MTIEYVREEVHIYDRIKRGIFLFILAVFAVLLIVHFSTGRLTLATKQLDGMPGDTLYLEGSATARSMIEVIVAQQQLGIIEADKKGHWRLAIEMPSKAGRYDLNIVATDADSNVIDNLMMADQLVVHPAPQAQPSLDNFTIKSGTPPWVTLSGTATANSRLILRLNHEPVGITEVDSEGAWTFSSASFATAGAHQLTLEEISSVGVPIPNSLITETVRLDETAFGTQPTVEAIVTVEPEPTVGPTATIEQVVVVEQPRPTATATAQPAPPTIDAITQIGGFQQPQLQIVGSSAESAHIQLLRDDELIAEVATDAAGNWQWEGIAPNYDSYRWQAVDENKLTASQSFAPEKPIVDTPSLKFEDGIAFGVGTPGSLILLTANGVDLMATKVDENGHWTSETLALTVGDHLLSATALDVDSEPVDSAELSITIAQTPHIITIQTTASGNLSISGHATPNSKIQLLGDEEPIATISVDENGVWYWSGEHVADRKEAAVYVAVDAEQVRSQPFLFSYADDHEIRLFQLDHADLAQGLTISGTAQADSQIQMVIDGVVWATIAADESGAWAWQAALPTFGNHRFTAQTISAENEIIDASQIVNFARYETPKIDVEAFLADAADGEIGLIGSATPGGLVGIVINGRVRKNAIVDEAGLWSWNGSVRTTGVYTLELRTLMPSGDLISVDPPIQFSYYQTPELFLDGEDDLADGTLDVVGTAAPSTTLYVQVNEGEPEAVRADDNGRWEWKIPVADTGAYTFRAQIYNPLGDLIDESDAVSLEVTSEMLNTE